MGPVIDAAAVQAIAERVVGRERETELVVAALATSRNVLLEGPPGTGKSTVLRAIAGVLHTGFLFVEGNAELTPARLIGSHDPSRVLADGYTDDTFLPGPLVTALRDGALLYVEEINRVPEETLNVLVTVMSERELHVPRLGRIEADPEFRLVAAMNPFDAVGTGRISSAIYDRTCRVEMGYQSAADEREIVRRAVIEAGGTEPAGERVARIVELVRRTRTHPDIRVGSSIRGGTDMELLVEQLAAMRGQAAGAGRLTLDAALASLSGRIRLYEGSGRSPDEVIEALWREVFDAADGGTVAGEAEGEQGKAIAP